MLGKVMYHIFILLYPWVARCLSISNGKARSWLRGRKNWRAALMKEFKTNTQPVIWVHCASLGEFEQGRPVIEKIKTQYPRYRILLTFFSPSGYAVQKNYPAADVICYLPMDSARNASVFLEIVKPALVIFVKYEFWFHYLREIRRQHIPLLLVSAVFRKQQPFFAWYGAFYRSMLECFTHLFVQDPGSKKLLATIHVDQVTVSGDTRFDRVMEIKASYSPLPVVEKFTRHHKNILVAGSTWAGDDHILSAYARQDEGCLVIVAPHEISKNRIDECLALYPAPVTFSALAAHDGPVHFRTLIIDNIGMLTRLYSYATVCYVGGGFTKDGVHNVLEAAVYSKPVIIGPRYDKYAEAKDLIQAEGAFVVHDSKDVKRMGDALFLDQNKRLAAGELAGNYVLSRTGATEKIMSFIQKNRLLTN